MTKKTTTKKIFIFLLLLSMGYAKSEKYVLNEVRVIISGPSQTEFILSLDLRPSVLTGHRTLKDLVFEQLMVFDAERLKLTVSDEEVHKFKNQLLKMNNFTAEQLEGYAQSLGYSEEEVHEQFRRKEITDRVIDYRVRSNKLLTIKNEDVEAYWKAHVKKEEATFTLVEAYVETDQSKEEFEKSFTQKVFKEPIKWGQPFTLKLSELAADKQFITQKNPGDILLIAPLKKGFEITKLVGKTEAFEPSFSTGNEEADKKRSNEIELVLKQERFKEALDNYYKELLATAKMEFKHEADRREVYDLL
jgi:hypothetical protein